MIDSYLCAEFLNCTPSVAIVNYGCVLVLPSLAIITTVLFTPHLIFPPCNSPYVLYPLAIHARNQHPVNTINLIRNYSLSHCIGSAIASPRTANPFLSNHPFTGTLSMKQFHVILEKINCSIIHIESYSLPIQLPGLLVIPTLLRCHK